MLFWRAKAQKQAAPAAVSDPIGAAETALSNVAQQNEKIDDVPVGTETSMPATTDGGQSPAEGGGTDSNNVVPIASARLADRLLEIAKSESKPDEKAVAQSDEPIPAGAEAAIPGQTLALEALKRAVADVRPGSNILVKGPAGRGRRTAALRLCQAQAASLHQPKDWVYVTNADRPSFFSSFALAPGEGQRLAHDVRHALSKSAAMLDRIVAGDDHRLSVDILEEEHRHRHEHALDALRRRAEAQNIALVKTPDGFVLAPMHEGKVVRSEVFRALPSGLQREVEAKIATLEAELTNLVVELPSHEIATDDKHAALAHDTALRAVKPNLAITRKVFADSKGAAEVLDIVEQSFLQRAVARVRRQTAEPIEMVCIHTVLGGQPEGAPQGAPVIMARDLAPDKLLGVIGHDGDGRLAIRPGHLMRANGGFLIVEAWRLAANPRGWEALSAALESQTITPETSPGLAIDVESMPLDLKLILIADDGDWQKLLALDPGVARHFPCVVKFSAAASCEDVSETEFAALAAACAKSAGLRPLRADAAAEIFKDAKRRAGSANAISLDLITLRHILTEADRAAAKAESSCIRAADIADATRRHQQVWTNAS